MDWHDRYALNPRPLGEEPTPFIRAVLERPADYGLPTPPVDALCPGDGYGRNGLWLAERGYRVIANDLVPSAVDDANRAARERHLDYRSAQADLARGLSLPGSSRGSFGLIVVAWVRLPGADERIALNRACGDALAPGGAVVVVAGRRVCSVAEEIAEWPPAMTWRDFSDGDEVRIIGRRSADRAPQQAEATSTSGEPASARV